MKQIQDISLKPMRQMQIEIIDSINFQLFFQIDYNLKCKSSF